MKVVGIGGEPATGKTTLVREIMGRFPGWTRFKSGLLRGHVSGSVHVLGVYEDDEVYAGTDRLSMAVQADALAHVRMLASTPAAVLFEGDRLFTATFLREVRRTGAECLFLVLTSGHVADRHVARGDEQSEMFISGRRTKYRNIVENVDLRVNVVRHDVPKDTLDLATRCETFLRD